MNFLYFLTMIVSNFFQNYIKVSVIYQQQLFFLFSFFSYLWPYIHHFLHLLFRSYAMEYDELFSSWFIILVGEFFYLAFITIIVGLSYLWGFQVKIYDINLGKNGNTLFDGLELERIDFHYLGLISVCMMVKTLI